MGHFVGPDVTAQYGAKSIHAGPNIAKGDYTLAETASGSTTIAILPLPGGGEVADVHLLLGNNLDGTGAESVCVKDSLGNVYINTASAGTDLSFRADNYDGLFTRLTASANLQVQLCDVVGTGTVSTAISVIATYLAEKDKD